MKRMKRTPQPRPIMAEALVLTIHRTPAGHTVSAWDEERRQGYSMTYRSRRAAACGAFARITKGWAR